MRERRVNEAEPISVVGLGKVGLGLAACLARNGFDVLGIDRDQGLVDRINARPIATNRVSSLSCAR